MAGLLGTTYSDPRASILMGGGNKSISDDTIKQYYEANKNDPSKILGAALSNNISAEQYARATGSSIDDVKKYLQSTGINLNPIAQQAQQVTIPNLPDNAIVKPVNATVQTVTTPQPVATQQVNYKPADVAPTVSYKPADVAPTVTSSNANATTAVINPITDTVQGQLNKAINNQNSPLMVSAATRGMQYANSRGLLNSSIGASSAMNPMINAGLQIATTDAANSNQINMFNTSNANDISKFNASNANQVGMFNANNVADMNKFNAANTLQAGMFNASNVADMNKFNAANALQAGTFNAGALNSMGQFNAGLLNDINKFNIGALNDTSKFNAANALSASVANAGNIKDYSQLQTQLDIANLDSGTKLKIANIDALSKDSSLAASLNQQLMSGIVEINKQDKPADVRQAEISQLVNLTTQSIGLLQSFDSKIPALNFNKIMNNPNASGDSVSTGNKSSGDSGGAVSGSGTNKGSEAVPGVDGKVGSYGSMAPNDSGVGYQIYARNALQPVTLDTNDYKLSVPELSNVKGYIKGLGINVDLNDVAPQALINEINRMQGNQTGDASPLFFTPVYAPKAIDPSFYIYKAALPKYNK